MERKIEEWKKFTGIVKIEKLRVRLLKNSGWLTFHGCVVNGKKTLCNIHIKTSEKYFVDYISCIHLFVSQ